MEPGCGKFASHQKPVNTCTYSAHEYQLHRQWIALWGLLMGIFFCGLLCLDLLGYIHNLEEGAQPASFRLFCLTVICLCTYMRVQNKRGNATQVRLSFLAWGMLQFWGIAEFLSDGTKIPSVFLHGDIFTNLIGTVPVMVLGMTDMPRALLAMYICAHVLACAAFHCYLGGLQWPLALMRSAVVHMTCSGAFLTVKRKCAAAYAAHLASGSGLAGPVSHSLLSPGATLPSIGQAKGGKCSDSGSTGQAPGILAAQEGEVASSTDAEAPHQQSVARKRAGAKRDAAVMQRGSAEDADLAEAAADGQDACAGLQLATKWAESLSRPRYAPEPAPVMVGNARPAAETPPLLCRRRYHKLSSRSDQQFQVHLKIYGDLHPEDFQADLAQELKVMMRLMSTCGQPKTSPAIRSGSIILSFTWCCGVPLSQEQLPSLRSMAPRPVSQVLQSIKDMVPKWIGGTCLSGLIKHGAVVTLQVDGLLARCTWDAHSSSWRVEGSCTPQLVVSLPAPSGPLPAGSTPISSSGQAARCSITVLPAPVLLLLPTPCVLEQQQEQQHEQRCQQQHTRHRSGTGLQSWQPLDELVPAIPGPLSACEPSVLEAAVRVRLVADVHGLGDRFLTGWQPLRRTSEAAMAGGGAAPAAQQHPAPAALAAAAAAAAASVGVSSEARMEFQLVARAGEHFVPLDITAGACAAAGTEGQACASAPLGKGQPRHVQPRHVQAVMLLPPSLARTRIPLLLHLDLWRGGVCLASSTVLLLPQHLEGVALELQAQASCEAAAETLGVEVVTEEGVCRAATRACAGGAEDMCAAPAAEGASPALEVLSKATAPVSGRKSSVDDWEGPQEGQGVQQQQPEQGSVQSFMQDLMQDLVDYAEFCERLQHRNSPQAAMMEAMGGDLMDYAIASHMPALCQYLEQLSALGPFARHSCAEANELTAQVSSLMQQLSPPLSLKQQQQQQQQQQQTNSGGWCSSGRSGAEEAGLLAKASSGEACRSRSRSRVAMWIAFLVNWLVGRTEAVWRLRSSLQRVSHPLAQVFLQNQTSRFGGKTKTTLSKEHQN